MFAFLTVLYISVAAQQRQQDACEVSVDQVRSCALELCDFDNDGQISKREIQFVFDNVLSGVSGVAARLLSSPDRVLEKCGNHGSEAGSAITTGSFESSDECIDSCFKRRHFYQLVCKPLEDSKFREARIAEFNK